MVVVARRSQWVHHGFGLAPRHGTAKMCLTARLQTGRRSSSY
ncbi:hypothetical protein [Pseudenhygromyxa sp. WMMC2535]|nr:hypothetical protein [Pseudenhygromyxa sp. WMMC2535]